MIRLLAVAVSIVLLGSLVVLAQRAEVPTLPNQESRSIAVPAGQQTPHTQRIREGTAFRGKHVFFQQAGDRTVLYTVGDNQRFTCLENLALERILTTIRSNPDDRRFWNIDGEFTEFRGENFVLIRRAVVARPPTPTAHSAR